MPTVHPPKTRIGLTEWKQSVCECDCLFVGVSPLLNPATPQAGQVHRLCKVAASHFLFA